MGAGFHPAVIGHRSGEGVGAVGHRRRQRRLRLYCHLGAFIE
jgi:hypothetical protein